MMTTKLLTALSMAAVLATACSRNAAPVPQAQAEAPTLDDVASA